MGEKSANFITAAPPSTITVLTSTPLGPTSNGNDSPLANSALTNDDAPYDSESDLSEVAVPIIDEPSPAAASPSPHQDTREDDDSDASPSSPDAQEESEDADFDMEDSPAPVPSSGGERDARSTSTESRRPAKRKAGVVEEEHILANPELYGLRRSVRSIPHHRFHTALLMGYTNAGSPSAASNHSK